MPDTNENTEGRPTGRRPRRPGSGRPRSRRTMLEVVGPITVPLRGAQYCSAVIGDQESARFVREPDNDHDVHAIRVENSAHQRVGFLPRSTVRWLAPLLDAGKITLRGRALCRAGAGPKASRIALEFGITPQGQGIFRPVSTPATALEALHEMMRSTYMQGRALHDPTVLRQVGDRLRGLGEADMLPETRLVLALLIALAEDAEARVMPVDTSELRKHVEGLRLGTPAHHHNLTMIPLFTDNGHTPSYVLLSEALAAGTATVREVSAAGSVPELRLLNKGARPILVTEGEVLLGAKQHRVVNVSFLAPAYGEVLVPVSCVEQGRWHSVSDVFTTGFIAPAMLRAKKNASVGDRIRATGGRGSNQGEVWQDVAACLNSFGVESGTQSLNDAYEATGTLRGRFREKLTAPEKAAGALMLAGPRVLGMDVFDCPSTFHKVWPRLADSYALEAARDPKPLPAGSVETAQAFLQQVGLSLQPVEKPLGLGMELQVTGMNLSGFGILHEDRLCHLAAFSV